MTAPEYVYVCNKSMAEPEINEAKATNSRATLATTDQPGKLSGNIKRHTLQCNGLTEKVN